MSKGNQKENSNKSRAVFTVETYEDGRKFEGLMMDGKKNGEGKLTFDDGAYYKG